MKINKRLRLNTFISLGVIFVMMVTIAWTFREIYRADRKMLLADQMRKITFERILLRDNYIINPSEQTKVLWLTKSENIRTLLESASEMFTDSEEIALLQATRNSFEETFSSFSEIMKQYGQSDRAGKKLVFSQVQLNQISYVFQKAQSLNDGLDNLYELSERAAKKTQIRGAFLIVFFIMGGTIMIVANSVSLNKMLAKRMSELHDGIKIIGGGNLDYRIGETGGDELSDLARITNEVVKNLQQEIIFRKQVEAGIRILNAELETFSYSVSHDLRAPLRGIDGWSLALLEDYDEKLDDQARKYLQLVRTETQQMGRLIDDMLKLSRVTRAELKLTPIDLAAMAHSIVKRLHEERPDRRIEFIIQPALRTNGDNQLIDIALFNLLDNAVKFTGTRSHARIELGEVEVDGGKTFFVRDNGVGFDRAFAGKLFGAFQRLHKSSEVPGTGIGLATVQRIIHRHGGRIWADAQVDQGATFYFTLKETI